MYFSPTTFTHFSEASPEEAYVMKESIATFCEILGQEMDFDKSTILSSDNVNRCGPTP